MVHSITETKRLFSPPVILPGSVRVRIAPSPTGELHLGTARSALFNFLFARKYQGVFILRIEDTDVERSKPQFERNIVDSLNWLGLEWDEGVITGGDYAPYRQSERTAIYAKYLERLLNEDKAYFCFCSPETLEKTRARQQAEGKPMHYEGTCQNLSSETIKTRLGEGVPHVLRLRIPSREIMFQDLIRGTISFDASLFGDIAIAKGVSIPLYNFAAVIDDHEMAITHVLRGEDHIANTPKQILISEALGWPVPYFGHFPLILGSDRSKLSKRHGATSVKDLKDAGYFPEAVINFLALLGWNPKDDRELFTIEELIDVFSLDGVQKGGAVWNQEKLEWFNKEYAHNRERRWLSPDQIVTSELVKRVAKAFNLSDYRDNKKLARIALLMVERISLKEFDEKAIQQEFGFFFSLPHYDPSLLSWKGMDKEQIRDSLEKAQKLLKTISENSFEPEILLTKLMEEAGEKRGEFLWPLRVALSGQKISPGPHEIAAVLGKKEGLMRLSQAIDKL